MASPKEEEDHKMAHPHNHNSLDAYDAYITEMRTREYPMLDTQKSVYLDHAGTTLTAKTALDRFHADLVSTLYGNPHSSAASSSQASTHVIEDVRVAAMRLVGADPTRFDLVFTANATAAIKLVAEALREIPGGFRYAYHCDSHTSLVGVRELALGSRCLVADGEVEAWLDHDTLELETEEERKVVRLFAYPAQSNLNGRRLPLAWSHRSRHRRMCTSSADTFTLLDAAAYASTSRLDFSQADSAPDCTVLSFYKIFGFPDLGALLVRREAAPLFHRIKYFGGGTVDMVVCLREEWHAKKSDSLHERLEDGTLQFHNIIALKSAMETHKELYGTLDRVSLHTADLAKRLYDGLRALRHGNGEPACAIHKHSTSSYGDPITQGPIVAFNLRDSQGRWISNSEVEKLAAIKDIHLRTGGVCNPGGVAISLNLAPWEMRENFSVGFRCGTENDIINGKPTGVVRLSLGAMSTRADVGRLLELVKEFFVEKLPIDSRLQPSTSRGKRQALRVDSLTVYPIKSCAGFQIPEGISWEIKPEGLAWDREWCLIHRGTGKALSQKQYPRMALIRPTLDFQNGVLRVAMAGRFDEITIPLSRNPALYETPEFCDGTATVCGDALPNVTYVSPAIEEFFSKSLGVPCTLSRFTTAGSRHCKPHLQGSLSSPDTTRPIQMSNESPILTVSRASLDHLNEQISANGGKGANPSVFRPNIVLAAPPGEAVEPWAEDHWHGMQIGDASGPTLEFLGGCRRCQMVCVDQVSAEKNAEPYVTLAKIRRSGGRVLFGVHTALADPGRNSTVRVGDLVETFGEELS